MSVKGKMSLIGIGAATCVIATMSATGALDEDSLDSDRTSTAPSFDALLTIPECSDPQIASEVHRRLSGNTEVATEGLLANPNEVPEADLLDQQEAWSNLSSHDRKFQECLGAHQALVSHG